MRWYVVALTLFAVIMTTGSFVSEEVSADSVSYDDSLKVLTIDSDIGDFTETDVRPWDSYIDEVRSIVVSEGVTSLGDRSFRGCVSVVSISLPSTLVHLGMFAFGDCTSLMDLDVASSGLKADADAFHNAGTSSVGVNVTYSDDVSEATRLFHGTEKVASVDLANVIRIADRAFYGLVHTEFSSMSNVRYFGDLALYGCTGIGSLVLGKGLTHLGEDAFLDCSSLNDITFSASLCEDLADSGAFRGTADSLAFRISAPCSYVPAHLFEGVRTSSLTISESVSSIGKHAFMGYDGAEIVLPSALTSIGEEAFLNCTSLFSLEITDTVSTIGRGAFDGCSGLRSVAFMTDIDDLTADQTFFRHTGAKYVNVSIGNMVEVPANLFLGFSGMSALALADSIVSIGDSAFAFCSDLVSLDLNNVVSIGVNAFLSCDSLKDVSIPSEGVVLGERAFAGCGIERLSLEDVTVGAYALHGNPLTELVFNGQVRCIADSLSGIGQCSVVFKDDDILLDPVNTFSDCGQLGITFLSETVPSNILDSFSGAFWLKVHSQRIGDGSFRGCTGLTSISLGDVTDIGEEAFRACTTVKELTVPASLVSMGAGAFSDMTGLESLTYMADGVTIDHGSEPFSGSGCEQGMNVKVIGDVPVRLFTSAVGVRISNVVLQDTSSIGAEAFRGSTVRDVTFIEGLEAVGDHAFAETGLETVSVPGTVALGKYVFSGCTSLRKANVSDLKSVPEGTFDGCISLGDILFGNGLVEIRDNAFRNIGLESLQLPYSVGVIGIEAFRDCSKLSHITILAHNVTIMERAFYGCPASVIELQSGTVIRDDAFSPTSDSKVLLVGCPLGSTVCGRPAYSGQGQGGGIMSYDLEALDVDGLMLFAGTVIDVSLLPADGKEFTGWLLDDGTECDPSTFTSETTFHGTWVDSGYDAPPFTIDREVLYALAYIFMMASAACLVLANIRRRSS